MRNYTTLLLIGAVALILAGCSQDDPTAPMNDETGNAALGEKSTLEFGEQPGLYEVIVENMTPATGAGASQPFSPPILATHKKPLHIFQAGKMASSELAQVAEDAVGGPLVDMLNASKKVHAVTTGSDVILPGGDMRLEIEARPGSANLSVVFMLVNTNDAFGGLDGVKLPKSGEASFWVPAYDAGSEVNTESASDIPGPCCGSPGMGTDEYGVVMMHEGITGAGDLDPAVYGWDGAVAKVTVRRIDQVR